GVPPLAMTKDRHARMSRRRFEEVKTLRPGEIKAPPSVYQLCETMLAIDPRRRYQTPSQLLDAVRTARRDVESGGPASGANGEGSGGKAATRSVFLVESNERLQEQLREKFKDHGYRVYLANDPVR